MRLWHIDLLPYLPADLLRMQWFDCLTISARLSATGTPSDALVNRITDYPSSHFFSYCVCVQTAMTQRGELTLKEDMEKMDDSLISWSRSRTDKFVPTKGWEIFPYWFTPRYLRQCLCNLQEKYDCGVIGQEEWAVLEGKFGNLLKEGKH